jgi:hypothetical protein
MLLEVGVYTLLDINDKVFDEDGNDLGYSAIMNNTDIKIFDKDDNEICDVMLYDTETKTAYFVISKEDREKTVTEQNRVTTIGHSFPTRDQVFEGSYAVVNGKRV